MFGSVLFIVATLAIFHAAFSTYQHLSYLKALGRPAGSLPQDIVFEALAALFLAIVGATIRTPDLREVTWRSEMKRRSVEDQGPWMSFATFAQRAGILPSKEQ